METWVVTCLLTFLCGTYAETDVECTYGVKGPHLTDCSMYYICDYDGNQNMFVCPRDLLYNPLTSSCDPAEKVTCFSLEGKDDENTTTVKESGEYYNNGEQEARVDEVSQGKEPDRQKGMYYLDFSTKTPSKTEELDIFSQEKIRPSVTALEEEEYLYLKSNETKPNEEGTETDKGKFISLQVEFSDKSLGEETDEVEKNDKPNSEHTLDVYSPLKPDVSGKDYESSKIETDVTKASHAYSPDLAIREANEGPSDSYGDETDQRKKRETSKRDGLSKEDGSDTEGKNEDVLEKFEDKVKEIATHDANLHIPKSPIDLNTPLSKNSEMFDIIKAMDTNILKLKSITEPIGNWSERIKNGWTDLKIFWKHPVDKDFQGSVNLAYPADSKSSDSEIQDLLLKMLDLGTESEGKGDEKMGKEDSHVAKSDDKAEDGMVKEEPYTAGSGQTDEEVVEEDSHAPESKGKTDEEMVEEDLHAPKSEGKVGEEVVKEDSLAAESEGKVDEEVVKEGSPAAESEGNADEEVVKEDSYADKSEGKADDHVVHEDSHVASDKEIN